MRIISLVLASLAIAIPGWAQDQMYFTHASNVRTLLVEKINAEKFRIDMSASVLTDRAISTALLNRHRAGITVRLIGDQYAIFDRFTNRRTEFYWLASQGVPIRIRTAPSWYPELAHWQATVFVGQNIVSFGSVNYTPEDLVPSSGTYTDGTVMFTKDPELVNAFKARFDTMWHDANREIDSLLGQPPYFMDWDDMCSATLECEDYYTTYPTRTPMVIDTARLESDAPTPNDLLWGQGAAFNNRIIAEINRETNFVDIVVNRLTVASVADALIAKHQDGVRVRIIIEPDEYRNRRFPEFWLTSAHIDRLWGVGIPIKKRAHAGSTQMRMLVTSDYATNASANFSAAWQRDHNYFVSADRKPGIYTAMRTRFQDMWSNATAFTTFSPEAPDAPSLRGPNADATGVPTTASLIWSRAAFATSYDVYLGTSPSAMSKVATVAAHLVAEPPTTYSWRSTTLQSFTTYYWRIDARTMGNRTAPSSTRSFRTGEAAPLTVAPSTVQLGASGGTGLLTVTTNSGALAWTATSSDAWLAVAPASGTGSASVRYTASYNSSSTMRSATVTINGVTVSFLQAADVSPGPPTGLKAVVDSPYVYLAWSPPAGGGMPLKYQVELADNPAFTNARSLHFDSTPSYRLSHLAPATYFVRVSALNGVGISGPSSTVQFVVLAPSDVPQSLFAQVQGSTVRVAWRTPPAGAPQGYILEAGLAPGRTDFPFFTPTRELVVHNVPIGVYYVRVRAVWPTGWSEPAEEIAIGVGVPVPPPAPIGFNANVSGSTVTLQWTPRGGVPITHYVIEAGYSPGASNAAVAPIGPTPILVVPDVPPGRYYVRIRAANGVALSAPSNEIEVVVP